MQTLTITLAGKPYEIGQLTLGQLRDLAIGVVLPDLTDPQESVRRSYERTVTTIATALREKYTDLTLDKLWSMPISSDEMKAANLTVLRHSGLLPPKRTAAELRAEIRSLQAELALKESEESTQPGETIAGDAPA